MTRTSPDHRQSQLIRVLEHDPELAEALEPLDRQQAIREAVAVSHFVPRGVIGADEQPIGGPADLGCLLLEGFVGRITELSGRRTLELLGPGDFGRPWDVAAESLEGDAVRVEMTWVVIQTARWALLDARFSRVAGRYPELMAALMRRATERSRRQALYAAAAVLPKLQDRLLVILWLAADRWGRVTPNGVVVPIRMTQAQLAAMAGARRPSVSTAMTALAARGLVLRQRGGGWCLTRAAAQNLDEICARNPTADAVRNAAAAATRLAPGTAAIVAAGLLGS